MKLEQVCHRVNRLALLAGLVVYGLLSPTPAYAYLDAGTGSLIVQALLAGVVGVGTVTKLYWGKIRGLWSRTREPEAVGPDDAR